MGSFSKRLKRVQHSESEMGSEEADGFENEVTSEREFDDYDDHSDYEEEDEETEGESEAEEDEKDASGANGDIIPDDGPKYDEMEELEREYKDLQNREKNLIQNLKRHKDEDLLKGQALKNQKALWDKALELRIQLQKPFFKSNKLPLEPVRSLLCESDEGVSAAYSDLIGSSKKTINSLALLQEALLENNPSIVGAREDGGTQSSSDFQELDVDEEKEWLQISQMQIRVTPFRNKAIDKWQRKADVNSGAVAKRAKLLAFNQNISDQVATYMRDPSKMIRSMQMKREEVGVLGFVAQQVGDSSEEANADGDPELLADSEFYQQLLKEFLETVDHDLSFDVPKKLQAKKRKVVDRRASKSRKIRYHVHEKIVNFMAPQPVNLPPMAPKLFENLFGLKNHKPTSAA